MQFMKSFYSIARARSSIAIIETAMTSLLSFVTYAAILRFTSLETVGLWVLLSSLLGISRAADIWSRGISSYVSQERVEHDDQAAATYVTTAALSGAVGYFLIILIAMPVLYFSAPFLVEPEQQQIIRDIIPYMGIAFWLMSMGIVYQLGFLGFGLPIYKAAQCISGALLFLILIILIVPQYGLIGLIFAQILQALYMLLFAIYCFHGRIVSMKIQQIWDSGKFKNLFIFGSKATGIGILQLLTEPLLRLIANHFGGLSSVAIVDLAAKLIAIIRNILGSIGQNLVPSFATKKNNSNVQLRLYFSNVVDLTFCLSLPLTALMIAASPLLSWVILGSLQLGLQAIVIIFALGWWFSIIASPSYYLIFGWRQVRILTLSQAMMLMGMALLGVIGGWVGGLYYALMGAMMGVTISSLWLIIKVHRQMDFGSYISLYFPRNRRILWVPILAAMLLSLLSSISFILPIYHFTYCIIILLLIIALIMFSAPIRDLSALLRNIDQ